MLGVTSLDVVLVRLHAAQSRALHVLQDAERSLVEFEERLALRKARLRALGYLRPRMSVLQTGPSG